MSQTTSRQFTLPRGEDAETLAKKAKRIVDMFETFLLYNGLYYYWYEFKHRAVYVDPKTARIAYTDDYRIYLGREFFHESMDAQFSTLLHELTHGILRHSLQLASYSRRLENKSLFDRNVFEIVYNTICDAITDKLVINTLRANNISLSAQEEREQLVSSVEKLLNEDVVKLGVTSAIDTLLYKIHTGEITVMAYAPDKTKIDLNTTDIFDVIEKHGGLLAVFYNAKTNTSVNVLISGDCCSAQSGSKSRDRLGGQGRCGCRREQEDGGQDDDLVKVREPMGNHEPSKPEDLDAITNAAKNFETEMKFDKAAGSSGLADTIYEMSQLATRKPKWLTLLKRTMTDYMSEFKDYTWSSVNRMAPYMLPGSVRINTPHVIILLDVSGSMLDGNLEKALGEIIGLVEQEPESKVTMYTWSTECSLPVKIDRKFVSNLKRYRKIHINTGGTVIRPALEKVLEDVDGHEIVVIMTDGYIFDIEESQTVEALKKLAKKVRKVLFISTEIIPPLPKEVVALKIEN